MYSRAFKWLEIDLKGYIERMLNAIHKKCTSNSGYHHEETSDAGSQYRCGWVARCIQTPSTLQPTPNTQTCITSHPRIAHGQRYLMPCLEWLAEEVEWEQGSGPKKPMSCRTQGWISRCPEADLKSGWQYLVQKSRFETWGAGLRPRGQICGLKSWFEAWRVDLRSWGQIWGLESWFELSRAKLRSWKG